MSKTILLFSLLLISSIQIVAQPNYGFRAGYASSTMKKNVLLHQLNEVSKNRSTFRYGFDAAAFVKFNLQNDFALQGEFHYMRKGGTIKEDFTQGGLSTPLLEGLFITYYDVSYLEIPILIKYKVLQKKNVPSLFTGGSYGYALSQKIVGDLINLVNGPSNILLFSGLDSAIPWNLDLKNDGDFNRHDISAIVGLDFAFPLESINLLIDLRYQHDFTDWRTEKIGNRDEPQMQFRTVLLTLGVEF